ncbi:hypothetical protein Poly30_11320 [Planctomycetes bacterium Poly30]|uniref:Right handed beta helix domain-containing protein n=1 Tax=Saltatorellus ferox TaxID=2528018 RepID=A0A518ENH3_9BACT|nr:hypothetical protein Poly30_11320 [Planctomycetes bacterium Poly30]
MFAAALTLLTSLTALLPLVQGTSDENPPPEGVTWYVNAAGTGLGTGSSADPFTNIAYGVSRSYVGSGDTFLVAPGTYDDEEIDFYGKSLTIRSSGGSSVTTIIARPMLSPMEPHSAARLRSGEQDVLIEGFRFTGGTGSYECTGFTSAVGGAIEACGGASLTVRDCLFEANTAERGGSIYAQDASIEIEGCRFTGPGTEARGEAVYLLRADAEIKDSIFEDLFYVSADIPRGGGAVVADQSTLELERCTFQRNATRFQGAHLWGRNADVTADGCAFGSSTGYAGASISASGGTLRLMNSTVRLARAIQAPGAGIFGSGADVLVENCLFELNRVEGTREGGAIAIQAGRLNVEGSVFLRNHAGQGGAIAISQSTNTLISDCRFVANAAPNGGGAFASGDSFATIERSLFQSNTALPTGAGGAVTGRAVLEYCTLSSNHAGTDGGAAADRASLVRSIAWANTPTDLAPGVMANQSLVGLPAGATVTAPIDGDPRFWSGSDFHLLPGSPAIDAAPISEGLDSDGTRGEIGAWPYVPGYCPPDLSLGLETPVCTSIASSSGEIASLTAFGSLSIQRNRLLLLTRDLPPQVPTLLLASRNQGMMTVPGMLGPLCLGSPFLRLLTLQAPSRPDGTAPSWVRLTTGGTNPSPADLTVQSGDTWNFQLWFRDSNAGAVTNTSSAVQVTLR